MLAGGIVAVGVAVAAALPGDAPREGASAGSVASGAQDGTASAVPTVEITDIRVTDRIDPATGDPGPPIDAFSQKDEIRLWFSFTATDLAHPVTVVWFHEQKKVARLTAALPGSASQMVFPLPELAAEGPGPYRVEVHAGRDLLAAETFEVKR